MKLAFCLFAYRPYGGLQRDFYRIAQVCARRGHRVDVYTKEWQGAVPDDFNVQVLPVRGFRNHVRNRDFIRRVTRELQARDYDVVTGFNRMPGLDIYYAGDPCYVAKVREIHGPLYRLTARYRYNAAMERALFSPGSATRILLLSEQEMETFMRVYKTPRERFRLLPPGIARDRQPPPDAQRIRELFRREFGLGEQDRLLLMVGSGFRTKGLDRALRALASLPDEPGGRTRLMVVGDDKERAFRRQARKLGIEKRVLFMRGQPDVTRFMLGADLLIHPAYSELAGMVLLEAMIVGLPVLATDVCGYAFHIERAQAGRVLDSPFEQVRLNRLLAWMLEAPERRQWSENGIRYGQTQDLYSMPEVVADAIEAQSGRHGA
ncbi:MAG TPA: glycosyltransferase family 4 protein [Gammaproteobacteria bacterium]|nr:glycosyltransferase family 4 protein [Gammaproteobacteria bacterium]